MKCWKNHLRIIPGGQNGQYRVVDQMGSKNIVLMSISSIWIFTCRTLIMINANASREFVPRISGRDKPDTMKVIRRIYISVSTRRPLTSSISFSWNPMSVNPKRLLSIFTKSLNFPIPNGRYRIVNSCSDSSISFNSSSRKLSSKIRNRISSF